MVTRVGASSPTIRFNSGSNGAGSTLALPLVGRTLQPLQQKYSNPFAPLPEELNDALACEDYIEDSDFELFFEKLFKSDRTTLDKAQRKAERKAKREKRRAERKRKN